MPVASSSSPIAATSASQRRGRPGPGSVPARRSGRVGGGGVGWRIRVTRTESSFSEWAGLMADRVIGEVLDPAARACSGMVIGGVDVTLGIGCRSRRSRSAEASAEPSTLVSALTTSLASPAGGAGARRIAEDLVADHVQGGGDPGPDLARTHPVATGDRRGGQAEGRAAGPAGDQTGVEQPPEIHHVDLLGGEVGRARQGGAGAGRSAASISRPTILTCPSGVRMTVSGLIRWW